MPEDNHTHEHKGKSSRKLLDKKGREAILSHLNITEGQTIVDAGCGDGYMAKEFARLVKSRGRIFALDTDETAIESLKKTSKTYIIKPVVADITAKNPAARIGCRVFFG